MIERIALTLTCCLLTSSIARGAEAELAIHFPAEFAAAKASECGLGDVAVRNEETLQQQVLEAPNATEASDEELACIAAATIGYLVELPEAEQIRFDAVAEEFSEAWERGRSESYLGHKSLLASFPDYDRGTATPIEFAKQIEELCGPDARGAFTVEYGPLSINPDWFVARDLPPSESMPEAFACIIHSAQYAGLKFGFVGNEKVRD